MALFQLQRLFLYIVEWHSNVINNGMLMTLNEIVTAYLNAIFNIPLEGVRKVTEAVNRGSSE
jgi:hypothetical protein